jgi:hypothetical protein
MVPQEELEGIRSFSRDSEFLTDGNRLWLVVIV